ncbi:MAG: 50S ribosomal protein L6 [Patescibacteria group bacterium]
MSKIGKKIIILPEGVELNWEDNSVTAKGPKGSLTKKLALSGFKLSLANNQLEIIPPENLNKKYRSLWGTIRAVINNMVVGVSQPFGKVLLFEGVGYRAEVNGKELVLNLGYSHPVKLQIPEGIEIEAGKGEIKVSGIDKELVGLFAAKIRKTRKVEPYKGTGIRYQDEIIKRKAGKKMAGAA